MGLVERYTAGMTWQGYFKDTDANIFGIHQTDPGGSSSVSKLKKI